MRYLICWFLFLLSVTAAAAPEQCSYSTYKWNVHLRRAVEAAAVRKSYSELNENEVDVASGCSVCEQDQLEIRLPGLPPFKVCRVLAPQLEPALRELQQRGALLLSVTGYRVGMTRGNVDAEGNRTQFSNHSFGVAIDINAEYNGLYENCLQWGPQCRLRKDGRWDPQHRAGLTADGLIVTTLKKIGLNWGGEIAGQQKDFMHFSPTGY